MYPVRIWLVPPAEVPEKHLGHCQAYEREGRLAFFRIWIADNLSTEATWDTLAEEWAHVLRMHNYPIPAANEGHDAIYGAWFNEIKANWHEA